MSFSFDSYYKELVIDTLLRICFDVLIVLILLFFIYTSFKKYKKVNISFGKYFLVLFAIIFALILDCSMFVPELVNDTEENYVTITGEIDNIIDVKPSPRFYYEGVRAEPKIIIIDGEEYYIMTIGFFQKGEMVEINYLPNSHVVLYIDDAD